MRRENHGQLPLHWERDLRSQGVPGEAEQACRELLRQLLREVVRSEHERGITKDEREDQ
jgi:hypothetical protein